MKTLKANNKIVNSKKFQDDLEKVTKLKKRKRPETVVMSFRFEKDDIDEAAMRGLDLKKLFETRLKVVIDATRCKLCNQLLRKKPGL